MCLSGMSSWQQRGGGLRVEPSEDGVEVLDGGTRNARVGMCLS